MCKPNPDDSLPQQLAEMLSFSTASEGLWNADDLSAILKHQLSLAPADDWRAGDSDVSPANPWPQEASCFATYLELLRAPHPPLAILERMKQVSKASVTHPDSPLPEEVGTALYFAAIAAALVRCHERLTRLDDDGLRWGIQWALDQPWLAEDLRPLFREALEHLAT